MWYDDKGGRHDCLSPPEQMLQICSFFYYFFFYACNNHLCPVAVEMMSLDDFIYPRTESGPQTVISFRMRM